MKPVFVVCVRYHRLHTNRLLSPGSSTGGPQPIGGVLRIAVGGGLQHYCSIIFIKTFIFPKV